MKVHRERVADISGWNPCTDLRHLFPTTTESRDIELNEGNRLPYAPKHTFGLILGVK